MKSTLRRLVTVTTKCASRGAYQKRTGERSFFALELVSDRQHEEAVEIQTVLRRVLPHRTPVIDEVRSNWVVSSGCTVVPQFGNR